MTSLIILTLIFVVLIILLSLLVKRIGIKLLFPITFTFLSIGLFLMRFIVGGWGGMGLGAVSISLFVVRCLL